MARVSIVIPLYNKAAFVVRTLASIERQTFTDWELIVVDDGSTDSGPALVEAVADTRIRLVRQANQGPGAARNHGLRLASGEFVTFLDADDAWREDFLAVAVQALDAAPQAQTYTCSYFDQPGAVSSRPMWERRGLKQGLFEPKPDTSELLLAHTLAFLSPCTTVARTAVVRERGGFYEAGSRFGEDAYLWLQVLLAGAVWVDLEPRVDIFNDASGLSKNLGKARPLESFLADPVQIRGRCQEQLRPLLERLLSLRAFKTACVWGYWGEWRAAADLRCRYRLAGDWKLPYFWPSLVCSTPVGSWLGWLWRQRP